MLKNIAQANLAKKIQMICVVIFLASFFLPFSARGYSLVQYLIANIIGRGWQEILLTLSALLAIITIILGLAGKSTKITGLVAGTLFISIFVYELADHLRVSDEQPLQAFLDYISNANYGFWILIATALGMVITSLLSDTK